MYKTALKVYRTNYGPHFSTWCVFSLMNVGENLFAFDIEDS